jgi:iron(II)-dependent oxidoreductase
MVLIPAGTFMMGSEDGERYEHPVHEVDLEAFYIDVYEVTNAQFAEFLNEEGNQEEDGAAWLDADGEYVRIHREDGEWAVDTGYADYPVVEVSWYGARAFCEWRGARLPTEAEWEKAARGGLEGAKYPWGDEAPVCTPGAQNGASLARCSLHGTRPVGSFGPNGYGLYDMAGNVWEWVSSLYRGYPYQVGDGREDLEASGSRVLRGGSWNLWDYDLRVAHRSYNFPKGANINYGFRCSRSP